MDLDHRIKAFAELGEQLRTEGLPEEYIRQAVNVNNWFTFGSVKDAVASIGEWLTLENLKRWVEPYGISDKVNPQKVGVVMAGNIPLVGFHDALCVLLSGHSLYAKLSSDDRVLPDKIFGMLMKIAPAFEEKVNVVDRMKGMDAVIATGSDNTSRYFEYYFRNIPHLIRKNRTSVAVLTGNETPAQLEALGKDIFQYYGLGCRNISKLFIPSDFELKHIFEAIEPFCYVADHHKYFHNYEYNRAIYLLNKDVFWDNGFVMLKEDEGISSPVSVLFFERYKDSSDVERVLRNNEEKIQAIVGEEHIPFGDAQCPGIDDYADRVDTMEFLLKLS
ncbi:acyl-CoA reductase [Cytophagaceae bacterium ABcell3]|nr:acyl-CoA reductase [Cytophagaceae bacterium ABcell3]